MKFFLTVKIFTEVKFKFYRAKKLMFISMEKNNKQENVRELNIQTIIYPFLQR